MYKLEGTYKYLVDGVVVRESKNLITEAGRKQVMRVLGELASTLGGSVAVGLGDTAANTNDTLLTFEYARATVYLESVDFVSNRIVFKATLDEEVSGTIYETGLFSNPYSNSANNYSSRLLVAFGNPNDTWTNATYANTNNRLSSNALRVTASTSSTTTSVRDTMAMDISDFTTTDVFKIAFKPTTSNVSSFVVRFNGTDSGSYYQVTIPVVGTNYQIYSFNKSNLTKVGTNVDYSNITGMSLLVTAGAGGAGSIDFDGLRVERTPTLDSTDILVSRTVLSTPLPKSSGLPMDIEYSLKVAIA